MASSPCTNEIFKWAAAATNRHSEAPMDALHQRVIKSDQCSEPPQSRNMSFDYKLLLRSLCSVIRFSTWTGVQSCSPFSVPTGLAPYLASESYLLLTPRDKQPTAKLSGKLRSSDPVTPVPTEISLLVI